jgi:hypothetical protein
MAASPDSAALSVDQFAERYRRDMIPLGKNFSYLADFPLSEEDVREYLEEPIAAMPPSIAALLPRVSILLVPYLSKVGTRDKARDFVARERPSDNRFSWTSCYMTKGEAVLAFALKDQEVADYHYHLYHSVAALVAGKWGDDAQREYTALVRQELMHGVHGEVDEESWHLKQQLLRRQTTFRKDTAVFKDYVRQSFIDTLTLYLHGICCDIDVETGPRQLPSRFLRKRLLLLEALFPPPENYAVFPNRDNGKR